MKQSSKFKTQKLSDEEFAVFILSFGRAENIKTIATLKKQGFTGKIVIICSDDDEQLELYQHNFPHVEVFNKKEALKSFDIADNFENEKAVVFARNVCHKIAKKLGLKWFWELDDDYVNFNFRFTDLLGKQAGSKIKDLDAVLYLMAGYMEKAKLDCVAMAQGGDYVGGDDNKFAVSILRRRKVMNSFLCRTDKPFPFMGRINEDVNAYISLPRFGKLFLTIPYLVLNQEGTQKQKGGLTDIYLDFGTYVKSFYSVLFMPSSVKVAVMNSGHSRLHHSVDWGATLPMIIDPKHKKK